MSQATKYKVRSHLVPAASSCGRDDAGRRRPVAEAAPARATLPGLPLNRGASVFLHLCLSSSMS